MSSLQLRRYITNTILTLPPIIYVRDNFYSLYRVEGSSMEPALLQGDILLVRKSDVYPDRLWRKWTSVANSYEEEHVHQNALKVLALDASSGVPLGDTIIAKTFLKPPTIHELGSVIVFKAPDASKYPTSEFRVKRVIGLGGQICRASDNYHRLEEVPPFKLWIEGDNKESYPNDSVDSRTYGPICKRNVIGIAERIVWPPSRWGIISKSVTPTRSWWT